MLKRSFDLLASLVGLVLLSPLIAVLALAVWGGMGRPVLFSQVRPGMGGRPFRMWKFRTMRDLRGPDGELLPDERRMTRFGTFLRRSSLDELPELVNVLRGEMSLVGPRPLLMEYLPLYTPRQARRHEVRPGVTGWAQINGRNQAPWPERLEMDVWYVENRSFLLDLRILLRTVGRVVAREGIAQEGRATMERFTGTPLQP